MFEKYSKIIFHGNPSSGNQIVPCRWTDITKLIVTLCNFVNMPKNAGKTSYKDYRPCDRGHVVPTGLTGW
jgi:hypothetical protein